MECVKTAPSTTSALNHSYKDPCCFGLLHPDSRTGPVSGVRLPGAVSLPGTGVPNFHNEGEKRLNPFPQKGAGCVCGGGAPLTPERYTPL